MLFDGIEYTVDTPVDNALNLLAYVNNWMTTNNITDTKGNIIQYTVNAASPIWLIILGLGYMFTTFQKLVYAAGLHFNISSCSDQQLLNLAEIKGTTFLSGKSTTITCQITAAGTGPCVITTGDIITYEDAIFSPVYPATITAGTTASVIFAADTTGPLYIAAGSLTAFDTPPANFGSMVSLNSVPGTNEETISELRTRLQVPLTRTVNLDAAITAIRNLTGVRTANLFFNRDLVVNLVIAGMAIPPRCCGMIVQGYSDSLAETYFAYINVPCVGGSITQNYSTLSGQVLSVTYSPPTQVRLYIKVKVRIPDTYLVPEEYKQAIINMLLPASVSLLIGEDYTQKYLLTYLDNFSVPYMEIIGLQVSTDNTNWSDTTDIEKNQICTIDTADISFVEVV